MIVGFVIICCECTVFGGKQHASPISKVVHHRRNTLITCYGHHKMVHHQCPEPEPCITIFRHPASLLINALDQTACSQVWSGSNCMGVRMAMPLLHLRYTKHAILETSNSFTTNKSVSFACQDPPKFTVRWRSGSRGRF